MIATELKTHDETKVTPVFQRILVAVDFSEASKRAFHDALALAATHEAQVAVVHILNADWRYEMLENPPELDLERIDAKKELNEWVDRLEPGHRVDEILVKHGPVAQAILAIAAEQQSDLIILGTRARKGLPKLALGSVAEQVLRLATCPVLTIGPKADEAATQHGRGFQTILFATDFGPGSTKALPLVLSLAKAHQSKVIFQHVISLIPAGSTNLSAYGPAAASANDVETWESASQKRAIRQLKDWLPSDLGLAQEPEYVVGADFVAEGILTACRRFEVDLIVMGAIRKGSARVTAHVPWTAVHEVMCGARCPILTVAG